MRSDINGNTIAMTTNEMQAIRAEASRRGDKQTARVAAAAIRANDTTGAAYTRLVARATDCNYIGL